MPSEWAFLRGAGPAVNELYANGLVEPSGSSLQSVADLKGKKVAVFKGTDIQLVVAKILEKHGLKEGDIRAVNMDNATSRVWSSPLLDEYIVSQYDTNIAEAKRFGLIRNTFRFEDWAEPRFLSEVLKELSLEQYWVPYDKDGKPVGGHT